MFWRMDFVEFTMGVLLLCIAAVLVKAMICGVVIEVPDKSNPNIVAVCTEGVEK